MDGGVVKSGAVKKLVNSKTVGDKLRIWKGRDGAGGGAGGSGLKRKLAVSSQGGASNEKKRRRTQKEAIVSGTDEKLLDNDVSSGGRNSVVSVDNGDTSDHDAQKGMEEALGGNENRVNGSLGLLSFLNKDKEMVIPRRPRGLAKRKKSENERVGESIDNSRLEEMVGFSISRWDGNGGLENGLKNGKQKKKKVIDEIKDREDVSDKVDSNLLKKVTNEGLLQNGDEQVTEAARKRQKKRLKTGEGKESRDSFATDSHAVVDTRREDRENLEVNAAELLSSRFDPSCTGYGDKDSESTSYSARRASFSPSSRKRAESRSKCNESVDERSLRPGNRHKLKGLMRIRRHFYELSALNFNPFMAVDRKIKVFWPLDESWYFGLVKNYDPSTKLHHIKYEDREEEWISLHKERFKLLLLPGEKSDFGGECRKDDKPMNEQVDNSSGGSMDSEPIISWFNRSNHQGKPSSMSISEKHIASDLVMSEEASAGTQNGLAGASLCRKKGKFFFGSSMVSDEQQPAVLTKQKTDVSCSENSRLPLVSDEQQPAVLTKQRTDVSCSENSRLPLVSDEQQPPVLTKQRTDLSCSENSRLPLVSDEQQPAVLTKQRTDVSCSKNSRLPRVYYRRRFHKEKKECEIVEQISLFHGRLKYIVCDNNVGGMLDELVSGRDIPIEEKPIDSLLEEKQSIPELHALGWTGDNFASLRLSAPFINSGQVVLKFCRQLTQFIGLYTGHKSFLTYSILIPMRHAPVMLLWPKINLEILFLDSVKGLRLFVFEGCLKKAVAVICLILSVHCNLSLDRKFSSSLPVTSIRFNLSDIHALGRRFVFLVNNYLELNKSEWAYLDNRLSQECIIMKELPLSKCTHSNLKYLLQLAKDQCSVSSLSSDNGPSKVLPDCSSRFFPEKVGSSSTCVMSLPTAPRSLLNLHFKLIMENNAISSPVPAAHDSPIIEEVSAMNEFSKVAAVVHFVSTGDDSWLESSSKPSIGNEVNVAHNSVGQQIPEKGPSYSPIDSSQCAKSWSSIYNRQLSSDKSDSPSPPCYFTGNSPPSTSHDQVDEIHLDDKLNHEQFSTEVMNNGFSNGSKKPRTQVSYSLPLGAYDVGSKAKSAQRRGRPCKRNDSVTLVKASEPSKRCPDPLICEANVLVVVSDRCWRECSAKVMLEFVDHKEWWLLVKHSGVTKYSHKAGQLLQPGIVNRGTNAMMWKGDKDWSLEFTDRSQWIRFKEIHDECYNRNLRAAAVKNIPIPGVKLIEDRDDNLEVPFVRNPLKYYRQVGTEIDSALDPSRLVYDMDSDDEEWIKSIDSETSKTTKISLILFEKVMDMLEKAAYRKQCNQFKVDELESLMFGVAPLDVVKIIYDHWHEKRTKKGYALIWQFQPAPWKFFEAQVKEWELAVSKNSAGGKILPKPPQFPFCLRSQLRKKNLKQKSQKKLSTVGGQRNVNLGEHDRQLANGKKLNGFSNGETKGFGIHLPSTRYGSEKILQSNHKHIKPNKWGKYDRRTSAVENGKASLHGWCTMKKQYITEGLSQQGPIQIAALVYDELRSRDASSAAQRSAKIAKAKRDKAQRKFRRAEAALHRAVRAMMIAESMKASEEVNKTSEGEVNSVG